MPPLHTKRRSATWSRATSGLRRVLWSMCMCWLFKILVWLSLGWYYSISSTPFPKPFLMQQSRLKGLESLSSRHLACAGVFRVRGRWALHALESRIALIEVSLWGGCRGWWGNRCSCWGNRACRAGCCLLRHCLAVCVGNFERTHNLGSKHSIEFGKVLFYSKTGSPSGKNNSKLKILGISEARFLLRL